ncbi:MAG: class I SAM-dependent methyltransferase [Candidatus Bathyarchaeia archaeon]
MIRKPEVLARKLHLMLMNLTNLIGIREGMQVLDVGCGQGMFTVCLAKLAGESGKVVAIDITDEYLKEMNKTLEKYRVKHLVKFIKADAAELSAIFAPQSFDAVVSYRFIEELTQPEKLPKIIVEMAKMIRQNGKVALIELSTKTRNTAEENLIRLHRDIGGDYFPTPEEILNFMRKASLTNVHIKTVETQIWYSSKVFLKGACGQDEIWPEFRKEIMRKLWPSVEQHGMKYPPINLFLGEKT